MEDDRRRSSTADRNRDVGAMMMFFFGGAVAIDVGGLVGYFSLNLFFDAPRN